MIAKIKLVIYKYQDNNYLNYKIIINNIELTNIQLENDANKKKKKNKKAENKVQI